MYLLIVLRVVKALDTIRTASLASNWLRVQGLGLRVYGRDGVGGAGVGGSGRGPDGAPRDLTPEAPHADTRSPTR